MYSLLLVAVVLLHGHHRGLPLPVTPQINVHHLSHGAPKQQPRTLHQPLTMSEPPADSSPEQYPSTSLSTIDLAKLLLEHCNKIIQ